MFYKYSNEDILSSIFYETSTNWFTVSRQVNKQTRTCNNRYIPGKIPSYVDPGYIVKPAAASRPTYGH